MANTFNPAQCGCQFPDTTVLPAACGASFSIFMSFVEYILRKDCSIVDPCRRLADHFTSDGDNTYDFIVVGAGVAGPVVASRLSEEPRWKVLLLEAGPSEPTVTSVPAFAFSAIGTVLDWNYTTEPSTDACMSTNRRCSWPRGKMVSGSSGMQGMMYTRPHPSILDDWAKNNPGWSFLATLPYFKKSENNMNPDKVEPQFHGFSGPLPVQQFPSRPMLADAVVQAGIQMGYRNGDLNGYNQTGVAVAQMMVYEGLRASTARMYLRPHLQNRRNLQVSIDSHVTKVLIDPKTRKALGVQYVDKSGNTRTVYARKEVILSAGAINSPQILMLSGVGPRQCLKEVGIQVIVDLPGVGQNLMNHVAGSIGFFMNEQDTSTLRSEDVREFMNSRNGSLASTGLTQTTLFMQSKYSRDGVPDLQVFFDAYLARCSSSGDARECTGTGQMGNCPRRVVTARPTNLLPLSRGYLKLKSSDPMEHPLICPHYFLDSRDVDVLVEGIKLSMQLAGTPALQSYGLMLDTTPVKGCEALSFGTDEYFACAVRMKTGAENHQAGSCKMGPKHDPLAVVDNELKVHGVPNLRVVDASFFPTLPNSNPTSVIVMAAEKVSDLIKDFWKR